MLHTPLPDFVHIGTSLVPGSCPGCGKGPAAVFFEHADLPVHCNILWPSADSARRAPRGTLRLAACHGCGLLFNAAFDPGLVTYDESYENSLHYSPRFEAYAEELARELSARLPLRGRLVVEVGCGKGDFLRRLCAVSGARGLGIDASYDPADWPDASDAGITFVREPFSSLAADVRPALVFCRHVLEHLAEPHAFVSELADAAARTPDGRVLIEVPNVLFTLRDLGIWDLIYEHCSYFSAPSLTRLCERSGLHVERVSTAFGDQFLCVQARPGAAVPSVTPADDVHDVIGLTRRFSGEYAQKVAHWESHIRELHDHGRAVVLWGAGSKGVTFVNTVPGGERLSALVDLNPRKQGRFAPGTGQPVVAPEALRELEPDVVIAMNPLYRAEIEDHVRALGVAASVEIA
jgi:SAM-dependent methyltransferase